MESIGIGFARIAQVKQYLGGVGTSTIYQWMAEGKFPKPKRLGGNMVAWPWSELQAWAESRESAASDDGNAPKSEARK